jgi:hypothetical protein
MIIKEWMGKEIQFPDDFQCNVFGKDTAPTVCVDMIHAEYKILLYVDSGGCSSCRLKLFQWQQVIAEADSLFRNKLRFLFFFQPKNKKEINYLLKIDDFDYPVFIDMEGVINRLNRFPDRIEYQCFLLDKDNKVLMIGSPASNPKIWELYKQVVGGQVQTDTTIVTAVTAEQTEKEINGLQVGKKKGMVD